MAREKDINIYKDTVVKMTVKQGNETERDNANLVYGELGYTRDSERLFIGRDSNGSGGILVGNKFMGVYDSNGTTEYDTPEYINGTVYSGDFYFDKSKNAFVLYSKGVGKDMPVPVVSKNYNKDSGRELDLSTYGTDTIIFHNFLPDNDTIICDNDKNYNILKLNNIPRPYISTHFEPEHFNLTGDLITINESLFEDNTDNYPKFDETSTKNLEDGNYFLELKVDSPDSNKTFTITTSGKKANNIVYTKSEASETYLEDYCYSKAEVDEKIKNGGGNNHQGNNNFNSVNGSTPYPDFYNAKTISPDKDGKIEYGKYTTNIAKASDYAAYPTDTSQTDATELIECGTTVEIDYITYIDTSVSEDKPELAKGIVLKAGTLLKAGSLLNGTMVTSDKTLTTDIDIQSGEDKTTALVPGSKIAVGSKLLDTQNILKLPYTLSDDEGQSKKLENNLIVTDYIRLNSDHTLGADSIINVGIIPSYNAKTQSYDYEFSRIEKPSNSTVMSIAAGTIIYPGSLITAGSTLNADTAYSLLDENLTENFYLHISGTCNLHIEEKATEDDQLISPIFTFSNALVPITLGAHETIIVTGTKVTYSVMPLKT
jgi:hypothetical protein